MTPQVARATTDAPTDRAARLRRRFEDGGAGLPEDLPGLRRDLDALRGDFEEADRPYLAEVARRVVLLTEVWECLAAEGPATSREVADFCRRAIGQLAVADVDASDEADADADLAWVIQDSDSRWNDYLEVLDAGLAAPSGDRFAEDLPAPDETNGEDEPSAIDPSNLLRMLIGAPTDDPPAQAPRPNPTPAPVPRFEEAVQSRPAPAPPRPAPPSPLPAAFAVEEAKEPPALAPVEEEPDLTVPASLDPELREAFLAEATDLFERIEALVLRLNQPGPHREALYELGRCFHTLKGAAGSVGLIELASRIHALEESLDGGAESASDELIDLFHGGLRYLEAMLGALRRGPGAVRVPPRTSPSPSPSPSPAPVRKSPSASTTSAATTATAAPVAAAPREDRPVEEPSPAAQATAEGPLRVPSARIDDLMDLASELITRRGLWAVQAEAMKEFASQSRACRHRLMANIDRFHDAGLARESAAGVAMLPAGIDPKADVPWLVRRLTEQAGDLAVLAETAQAATIVMADHRDALDRLTLQLWEALQAIRITPVRGLFQRLARVALDAARVEGRHVEVVMSGEENGLDRAIQDKAFEPMLHMVRNAVGHGIESPEGRRKAGKPDSGRVTLAARREGNTLVLSVGDDGRGLDYAAIEAKGRRLGLIAADESPSIARLNALVFHSGFSTREEANAISGRGVGMDVVSQEVARLHGTIDLVSQRGQGTQLSLRLPVRLALERVMTVRVEGQAFALPVSLVDVAQQFDPAECETRQGKVLVKVRDCWVPLVDAREVLGFSTGPPASNPKLLLVRADDEPLALLVDAIEGTSELVLRPLGPLLAGHPVISGTGLSIDGEVILALNPSGMSRWLGAKRPAVAPNAGRQSESKAARVLVVDDSISVRRVVTRNLRTLGLEVEEVSNGMEALARLKGRSYALVVSDLEMPHLDGFELLAELGRTGFLGTTPVVVASTKCDPETRDRVLALGARAFVTKPVEPEVLDRVLRPLLEPRYAADPPGLRRAARVGPPPRD